MGEYIKSLREQKNWTQEELAEKLTIGRTAISKWERGTTIPDPSILIKLSELFGISINEILMGQRSDSFKKNDSVILELYKRNFKNKKLIKLLSFLIVIVIIIFLLYYFLTSYKSTSVYNVSGIGENVSISNGFLIYTREKYYFTIGNITNNSTEEILKLELYIEYKDEQLELLSSVDDNYLFVTELNGYDEYELKKFVQKDYKTFLKVYYKDTYELLELKYTKDYTNDYFIPFKVKNASVGSATDNTVEMNYSETSVLLSKIKNTLTLDNDNNYSKNFEYKNNSIDISYNLDTEVLNVIVEDENEVVDIWNYNIELNSLTYISDYMSYLYSDNSVSCLSGNCEIYNEKNNEFWEIIFYLIKY